MSGDLYFLIAALCSGIAALLHLVCIYYGAPGYRFFGAGEEIAQLAEKGSFVPAILTLGIACVLAAWSLYALSTAGVVRPLPFLQPVLVAITAIYLLRALVGFFFVRIRVRGTTVLGNSPFFWAWSSAICLLIGITHLLGLVSK